jgi:CHAT domain-containing protein
LSTKSRSCHLLPFPVFSKQDERVAEIRSKVKQKPLGTSLLASMSNGLPESSGLLRSQTVEKLNLQRLSYTRQEARAILASAPQAQEMVDFEANRARVIGGDLPHYRIVHFATHGMLDTTDPELSGLVLSLVDEHGNPQNGFLGLEDIYNLQLSLTLSFSARARQPWERK